MHSRFPILCLAACGLATLTGPAGAENALEKLRAQIEQAARGAPARTATLAEAGAAARTSAGPSDSADFGSAEGTARIAAAIPPVDVVGIRLGMPADEALAALKAHAGDMRIEPSPLRYAALGDTVLLAGLLARSGNYLPRTVTPGPTGEGIEYRLTMAPNPATVWAVNRELAYTRPDVQPATDTVLAALKQKYGQWSDQNVTSTGGIYRWFFDLGGRLIPQVSRQQAGEFDTCQGQMYAPEILPNADSAAWPSSEANMSLREGREHHVGAAWASRCTRLGTVINARLDETAPGRLRHVAVNISHPLLKWSGNEATRRMLGQAQAGVEAKKLDDARRLGAPKF